MIDARARSQSREGELKKIYKKGRQQITAIRERISSYKTFKFTTNFNKRTVSYVKNRTYV